MPSRADEAFVLTRYPYRERDLVVVLLTRGAGQARLLARRARGVRAPLAAALEPLTLVRVSYFEKPQRELGNLDEASVVRSAFPLAAFPARWAAGQVVAELALTFCPPGQRAEPAFRLVDHCIERLLAGGDPLTVAHYAELWFVKLAGVFPEPERCGFCGEGLPAGSRWFDPSEGTFACAVHRPRRGALRLGEAGAEWLRRAVRLPVEAIETAAPPDAVAFLDAARRRFTERDLLSWRYLTHVSGSGVRGPGSGKNET